MSVLKLLASSLNRRDDNPNKELAIKVIKTKKTDWIKELVDNLENEDKNIQSDCIKVLYEIGERGAAELIAPYYKEFGKILKSRNNRLTWGAMTALDTITAINPQHVLQLLPEIVEALDEGSVITVDHGVSILARLSSISKYTKVAFPLLMKQLNRCTGKQLPMYAEKSIIAITSSNKKQFLNLLQARYSELENTSQVKRIDKVIKKINNAT
jgi:hypothetical protein